MPNTNVAIRNKQTHAYPADMSLESIEVLESEPHHKHRITSINGRYCWEEIEHGIENAFAAVANYKQRIDILFEFKIIDEFTKKSLISTKNEQSLFQLSSKLDLNQIIEVLYRFDCNKNDEIYRKMYRDIGYSLNGYWEIFYWDLNNDIADDYIAPVVNS